ncbi:MAG: hypothetical protein ACOYEJ_05620, partial [Mahellales bacterium]
ICLYSVVVIKNLLCYNINRWYSILVSTINFEGGPKNPSKGTTMKFLVLAANAQLGVGAGS